MWTSNTSYIVHRTLVIYASTQGASDNVEILAAVNNNNNNNNSKAIIVRARNNAPNII